MTSTEERAPASFITLPYELHDLIFPFLDPIALISLAQTSTTFRALICPQPHNFTERLLALELDPQHGGPIPFFTDDVDIMLPTFDDVETWSKIKYACTSCGKLRSHLAFDNHSILRLRKREPMSSSPTANLEAWYRQPMCNWEDRLFCNWYGRVGATTRGKHLEARIKSDKDAAAICKKVRRQPKEEQPKENLEAAEAWLCGSQRRRRTCNECRFQRGDFDRRTTSNCGDATTPVIKSRPMKFHDSVERYFPGLVPPPVASPADGIKDRDAMKAPKGEEPEGLVAFYLESQKQRYPIRRKIYRERDFTYDFWILHQVRCPGCTKWLELRHFRQCGPNHFKATPRDAPSWGSADMDWKGPQFTTWRCNACVAREEGEEKLAVELLQHWKIMAGYEMRYCTSINDSGWGYLGMFFKENKTGVTWAAIVEDAKDDLSNREKTVADAILGSGELKNDMDMDTNPIDPDILLVLFACWKRFVETYLKPDGEWERPSEDSGLRHRKFEPIMNPWFKEWTDDYYTQAARWKALDEKTKAFEAEPGLLVDYALRGGMSRGEQMTIPFSDVDGVVVEPVIPRELR